MESVPQSVALQILYLHGMLEEEEVMEKWMLAIWANKGWMRLPPSVVVFGRPK